MGEKPRRGAESFRHGLRPCHLPLTREAIGAGHQPPLPPPLGEVPPQGAERVSPAKKKSPGGGLGIDFFPYHVILKIKRGAAGRREPPFTKRSNRTVGTVGRLLLFIVVNMDEQSQNAHDELTDQDQFRMSHHMYHLPPRKRRLYKRSVASSRAMRMRGLPPTDCHVAALLAMTENWGLTNAGKRV